MKLGDKVTNRFDKDGYMRKLKKQIIIFAASAVILVALVLVIVFLLLPKIDKLEKEAQAEQTAQATEEEWMKETIELFEKDDYEGLKKNATEDLIPFLNHDNLAPAKEQFGKEWGKRTSYGTFNIGTATESGNTYKVGEVVVTYENVNVTYRLTYDSNGKLAGIYIR